MDGVYIRVKNDAGQAWKSYLQKILRYGDEIYDERGQRTLEISNAMIQIQDAANMKLPDNSFWTGEKLEKYNEQFVDGDKGTFIYTYGNRIREHFNIDQILTTLQRFKEFPETRRAVICTYDPKIDSTGIEIPCMDLVVFKLRDNKLNATGVWRSHDIYGAWIPNLSGLRTLTGHIAKELDVEVGWLTTTSVSPHIYATDLKEAEKIAGMRRLE